MAELQATVEVALQIHKFYNVDLFQRGYYQIRLYQRSTSKLPVSVEINLPRSTSDWKSGNGLVFPACVVNGTVVSKTFQILYRNEEVSLDDSANLKLHFIVDCNKMEDSLEKTELQLIVELWFTESTFAPDHHNAIQCISARTLQLNFSPLRGLHYHLPVLFDYFHLSAVTLSINCALVSLHQPYINSGKSSKSKYSPKMTSRPNMESVFFMNINSTVKCAGGGGTSSWRLTQARKMHRTICTLLLSAHTALAAQLEVFLSILPSKTNDSDGAASIQNSSVSSQPIRLKTDSLSEAAKECYYLVIGGQNSTVQGDKKLKEKSLSLDCEEDFILTANTDVAHLCAENILLWQQFLLLISSSEPIRKYLARLHHLQRVRRFSEAFFVIDNPRPSAAGCYDSNYQNYAVISEGVRRSRYLNLLPSLAVSCLEMDGDSTTIPVIFEDQYQHVAEFARRRSIAKRKSENFLNGKDIDAALDQLESSDRNEDLSNPPDVTKPTNGLKVAKEVKTSQVLRLSKSKPNIYTAKLTNDQIGTSYNSGFDQRYKYSTHPIKSQSHPKTGLISTKSEKNLKSIPSYKAKDKNRTRNTYGRSRSSDSRPFVATGGGGFARRDSGSDSEDIPTGQRTGRSLRITKLSRSKSRKNSDSDDKPPLPPRTDKMPKDFKPPIPPKTHKLPEPRSSLKEKLKNNLKLELKLPAPQDVAYKKTKFKVRLIQRAQQLKTSATLRPRKKTKKSESVLLLKYKPLEPSLSMPYNLGANTPGGDSMGEQAMKHSQSTLSMPSFLWDIAGSTSPTMAESFPDLLASETESSSELEVKKVAVSPRTKVDKSALTLSNVEVGLVSSADHALLQLGNKPARLQLIPKYKGNLPIARSLHATNMSIPESSSNSDIMSEQSGWVSTSSRLSSGSSSCQISPQFSIRAFSIKDMLGNSVNEVEDKVGNSNEPTPPTSSIDYYSLQAKKAKKSEFKINSGSLHDYKSYPSRRGKHKVSEITHRSSSNDHLLMDTRQDGKEFRKSQSLQRVGNTAKAGTTFGYEPVSLPPPPKEFRDPKPESIKTYGYTTTGRTHREVKANKKVIDIAKERPRSESPRKDNKESIHTGQAMKKDGFSVKEMNGSCDTSVLDVIGEMKFPVHKTPPKLKTKRDKFSSLPSMRKMNSLASGNEYVDKTRTKLTTESTVSNELPKQPNELPSKGVITENGSDNPKVIKRVEISPLKSNKRYENTSSSIPVQKSYRKSVDALSYLADSKFSLLELFLEQQGASVWAQRPSPEKADEEAKVGGGVERCREKSKSQPQLNDVYNRMSSLPPPPKPPSPRSTGKCTCPSESRKERIRTDEPPPDVLPQKLSPPVPDTVEFVKAREEFRQQINFQGLLYSDFSNLASSIPYFDMSDDSRALSPDGLHLIVCVHGLDGNSADLRLVKTYLEMGLPGANLDFLMSERNQGDTFSSFETLIDRLVSEILYHIDAYNINPRKISFVGHSLGNIIIRGAVSHPNMKSLLPKLHTFLSLSGPHLGTLYNNSGLVNMGMWFMQKWKRSGSLLQLALKDKEDLRQTFLYKLSQKSQLHNFKNVILCGSSQDRYVPLHSARIELCRQAVKDNSILGSAYREMVSNLLQPLISSSAITLVRFDIHHALPSTANSLIGRAAHIAVLDSELFIEKFLLVTGMKYFK